MIALVCLFSLLVTAGAGLWHHHEDDVGGHEECPVCVAMGAPASDGLAPPVLTPEPLKHSGVVALVPTHREGIEVRQAERARGPPGV